MPRDLAAQRLEAGQGAGRKPTKPGRTCRNCSPASRPAAPLPLPAPALSLDQEGPASGGDRRAAVEVVARAGAECVPDNVSDGSWGRPRRRSAALSGSLAGVEDDHVAGAEHLELPAGHEDRGRLVEADAD